jgi:hypothetical protein
MSRLITGDENHRDLTPKDAYRSHLVTRSVSSDEYRFGGMNGKRDRVRARSALRRVNGYFRTMIERIANAKLRRMKRELELRGIRFDRRVARNPGRTSEP